MGHCISVFLIRKEELRNEKIDSIIDNVSENSIKFTELKCGILATTYIPNIKEFGKNKTIAKITTDYFGGAGYQTAKLFVNNTNTMYLNDEFDHRKNPINSVLKEMGIEKTNGHDEFDTIGLGKYRSNTDFE